MEWITHKKNRLVVFAKKNKAISSFLRGGKWTAPRYFGASTKNSKFGKFLRITQVIASILALGFFIFARQITRCAIAESWFSQVGLSISLFIFIFLLIEFVFFRPRILNTLELLPESIHEELQHDYPIVGRIALGNYIRKWRTFFETKQKAIRDLKRHLFSGDKLRLHCFFKIFLRTLVLVTWFSMIILFLDMSTEYDLLHIPPEVSRSYWEHLYQSFSLFLSVSSVSILMSTPWGIAILLGQIVTYFSVFIVIIGRFSEYLAMYSNQIEDFAHASILKKVSL